MNSLIEMSRLAMWRPAPDASAEATAAWYQAKARLLEHLAAESPGDDDGNAAVAYAHARRLCRRAV